jgi:amino acid adenylation domain-containing protein
MSDSIFELDNLYPLSHGQRALWFMQRLAPDSVAYNFAHAARILTELDVSAFQRAIQRLVRRHPALRATFPSRDGEPAQRIHDHAEFHFRAEEVTWWSEARLNERLAEEVYRPFDLARGPLLRVFLFTRSAREHVVLLVTHHIVADLWSMAVVMSELGALYSAEKSGIPVALNPLPAKYTDYVRRQAELLAGPEGERLWAYWRKRLAGAPLVLNLPTDRPRPPVPTDRGTAKTMRLGRVASQGLKALARAHGATLFMTLLAAFQALLHRYTGQEDILVASPIIGRGREAANLIGYFVNPVVLRADFSEDPTFSSFLDQVRRTALEAFEHSAYPFSLLIERLQPERDPSRPPLVQASFAWQQTTRMISSQAMAAFAVGEKGGGRLELGKLQFESMALEPRVAPFELLLLMAEAGEELIATVEYNTDLFDAATIARTLGNFQTLLEGIVADPEQRISDLPLLTAVERQQLLVDWNDTAAAYPQDQCIHRLFETQVERTPDAIAVVFEGAALSYQALNQRANQLAHYLQKLGVGPEVLVGICLERSLEMIVGVLGVLKAGGAYVSIDPTHPLESLAFRLEDSQALLLLTQAHLAAGLPRRQAEVVRLDKDWPVIAAAPDSNPASGAVAENLAYVIYTSCSNGRPKGVLLQHRGLCNLVTAQTRAFGVDARSRILQFASFCFDASVSEIFMALVAGASLCLARRDDLLPASTLLRLLRDQEITTVTLPPSLLAMLSPERQPTLETVISAGDICSWQIFDRWAGGRRFFNAYGPIEATIGPTYCEVMGMVGGAREAPIGRPIANTRIYLLNKRLQPAPIGVPGEIYIGGIGLARGYLNCQELTAEKFIPNPFSQESGERLYRTGDLARYLSDGNLEFLGGIDHQVKIRGYRIELEEIEARLKQHPALREAIVVAREDEPGNQRLMAYVIPHRQEQVSSQELRAYLRKGLPDYMIPSAFVTLEALPLTPNGKVDRAALPSSERTRPELEAGYVRPRNETERAVAEVWQKVLGIERVGVQDNFFDLGGHSLMLAKVHSQMQEVFNRELPMIELFKYPTISALAEYLSREDGGQPSFQMSRQRAREQREAMSLG